MTEAVLKDWFGHRSTKLIGRYFHDDHAKSAELTGTMKILAETSTGCVTRRTICLTPDATGKSPAR